MVQQPCVGMIEQTLICHTIKELFGWQRKAA